MGEKSNYEHQDGGNEKRGEQATEVVSESRRSLEETMAMFDFGRIGSFLGQVNSQL